MDNKGDEAVFMEQFTKAQEAAQWANSTEPRAGTAFYDRSNHLIVIRLKNGATFTFPPEIAQGLAGAKVEDLVAVEITPSGDALHWESLDADFSVPDLLMGIFGSKSWMAQLHQE